MGDVRNICWFLREDIMGREIGWSKHKWESNKLILKRTEFTWLRICLVAGPCQHSIGHLSFMKRGEYFEKWATIKFLWRIPFTGVCYNGKAVCFLKSPIFWDMTPCSPLKVRRRFREKCCQACLQALLAIFFVLVPCVSYSSTFKMEAKCVS
jgi:hypothetical protein